MSRKIVSAMILTYVFMGIFGVAINIQRVKANRTVYIRADGSIDPSTAPISSIDDVTYYFTSDIYDSIVVERDSIIIDGAGYTLQGTGSGTGIDLSKRNDVTIKNTKITAFDYCIYLYYSSNSTMSNNDITNANIAMYLYYSSKNSIFENNMISNGDGVWLRRSSNNSISANHIATNNGGILLFVSSNNTVSKNNMANNRYGIIIGESSQNSICHNNFLNNIDQIATSDSTNTWDDGYPSGGNNWSNYFGKDLHRGRYQNITGSDGVGDMSYVVDANNTDNYPLMGVFSDFWATPEHNVQTLCNSTISDFRFNGDTIRFNVSGEIGTFGFCRVCIPTALMNGTYKVFVNGTEVTHTILENDNSTRNYLYFNYRHSTQEIVIVPEFSSSFILSIFMTATLLATALFRRKHSTQLQQQHAFTA